MRNRKARYSGAIAIALLTVGAVLITTTGQHGRGGENDARGRDRAQRTGPTDTGEPSTGSTESTGSPGRRGAPRLDRLASGSHPVPSTPAGKLRFGLGPGLDSAHVAPLANNLDFFTTWYNGPNDLSYLRQWQHDLIPQVYQSGHGIHLVVWLDGTGNDGTFQTPHGTACGRQYPLSSDFLNDARTLASIFSGPADGPAFYVTLFTELQTYPCRTNEWSPNPETTNYYLTLQDQYLSAMDIFHSGAPNARVSLGWGGWQARWDDSGVGGGRSLIGHFADVLRASDFESFQAMGTDSNAADVRDMTKLLGQYGPVMLAHYKSESQPTWESDLHALLSGDAVRQLSADGLFAFSFMDQHNIQASPAALDLARGAVQSHGYHAVP